MDVEVEVTCKTCGKKYCVDVPEETLDLVDVLYGNGSCPLCAAADRKNAASEAERRKKEEEKIRQESILQEHLEASNLRKYYLPYDPENEKSNRELFAFVRGNQNECLWIAGKTGLCKSRILQYWGRQACRRMSVQYWPSMDLLAYLSDNAKNIGKIMEEIYKVDLLILDDLGTENVTEAKMKYLFAIIDRRMIGHEQIKHGVLGRRLGGLLWISTNDNGGKLAQAMGNYASPCIRRLQEICQVWERF